MLDKRYQEEESLLCGTCLYSRYNHLKGGFFCNNEASENYGLETEYADSCMEHESRY